MFSLNKDPEEREETKLLYGFLYSLKSFTQKITPVIVADTSFFTYSTNIYQLFYLETPTNVRMVLIIERESPSSRSNDYFRQLLRDLYRNVYVEYHVKNPAKASRQDLIDSLLFRERLIEFFNKMYN